MIQPEREKQLREMVRDCWDYEIKDALDGSESVMKEIWEEISGDEEERVVKNELKKMSAKIKSDESLRSDLDTFIGLLNKAGRIEAADGPESERYRETTYVMKDYKQAGKHLTLGDRGRKSVTFIFKPDGKLDLILTRD